MAEDAVYRAEHERQEADDRERQRAWEASEAERAVTARRERLAAMGIPERVLRLLGATAATEATAAVSTFLAGDRSLLVLAGGEGNGKTVAACLALTQARSGLFVKASAIARAGAFDRELLASLEAAELLVIDDLGVEPLDEKGWAASVFASVIDSRYDSCRKTILTTNCAPDQFAERYLVADGGRLRGRLRESGSLVALRSRSMRGAP